MSKDDIERLESKLEGQGLILGFLFTISIISFVVVSSLMVDVWKEEIAVGGEWVCDEWEDVLFFEVYGRNVTIGADKSEVRVGIFEDLELALAERNSKNVGFPIVSDIFYGIREVPIEKVCVREVFVRGASE